MFDSSPLVSLKLYNHLKQKYQNRISFFQDGGTPKLSSQAHFSTTYTTSSFNKVRKQLHTYINPWSCIHNTSTPYYINKIHYSSNIIITSINFSNLFCEKNHPLTRKFYTAFFCVPFPSCQGSPTAQALPPRWRPPAAPSESDMAVGHGRGSTPFWDPTLVGR